MNNCAICKGHTCPDSSRRASASNRSLPMVDRSSSCANGPKISSGGEGDLSVLFLFPAAFDVGSWFVSLETSGDGATRGSVTLLGDGLVSILDSLGDKMVSKYAPLLEDGPGAVSGSPNGIHGDDPVGVLMEDGGVLISGNGTEEAMLSLLEDSSLLDETLPLGRSPCLGPAGRRGGRQSELSGSLSSILDSNIRRPVISS